MIGDHVFWIGIALKLGFWFGVMPIVTFFGVAGGVLVVGWANRKVRGNRR